MSTLAAATARRVRLVFWLAAAVILALPAIAMTFARGMDWGPGDFAVMAALLAMVGLVIELALRNAMSAPGRFLLIAGALALFLLTWAELAVGLFG